MFGTVVGGDPGSVVVVVAGSVVVVVAGSVVVVAGSVVVVVPVLLRVVTLFPERICVSVHQSRHRQMVLLQANTSQYYQLPAWPVPLCPAR